MFDLSGKSAVVPGDRRSQIHPEPDRWETAQADALVDLAEAHDMQVRGHTIVWPHWGTPEYVTECHDQDQP